MPKIKRGNVYSVDLGEGAFGYAVALKTPLFAFFNNRTSKDISLSELMGSPIAFRCCVYDSVVKSGRWVFLGSYDPDPSLDDILFFKRDKISGCIETYSENGVPPRAITAGEARMLEPAAVWTGQQVEDRLRDYFAGRPNDWLDALMP